MTPEDTRNLQDTLAHVDSLVSAGSYEAAQDQLIALRQDFPSSDDIRLRLDILDPLVRSARFAQEGKTAFNQGEYGEAVRALTQALELNPQDAEAQGLKARALQERDRLRQVREALAAGQRAMRDGDTSTAAIALQKVLQLDPAHLEATGLMGQIQNVQPEQQQEARFRQAMKQVDALVMATKFDDAQFTLLELRQEFPASTEIDQRLRALDQQSKLHVLLTDGQQALDHGEFGEAVRILTEAQQLAPGDEHVRDMKVRAVQERDRLRQVREAIAGGQRALRQGEADVAEHQFQRALQLDPANSSARALLAQVVADRQVREHEQSLQTGLSLVENLIAWKKFDDAEHQLAELRQAHPASRGVTALAEVLAQKRAEEAALPSTPAIMANSRPAIRPAPAADYAKSMALAEELRQSLLKPRAPAPAVVPKRPAAASSVPQKDASGSRPVAAASPGTSPPASSQETLVMGSGFRTSTAAPKAAPAPVIPSKASGDSSEATLLRGSGFSTNTAPPKPAPPPVIPAQPPAPVAVQPVVPVPQPPLVTEPVSPPVAAQHPPSAVKPVSPPVTAPRPPVVAKPVAPPVAAASRMSPVVFVVLGALAVALAVVAFLIFHHA